MDSLISRVKGKLEVLRLEKRYAKRTHRAAYHGGAEYRDGEYVRPNNTNNTGTTTNWKGAGAGNKTGGGVGVGVREMREGGWGNGRRR